MSQVLCATDMGRKAQLYIFPFTALHGSIHDVADSENNDYM